MDVLGQRGRHALTALLCANVIACGGTLLGGPVAAAAPATDTFGPRPVQYDSDFYRAPADFAAAAPGTILRARPVTATPALAAATNARAWELLYRTTDSHGRPMVTATMVLQPRTAKADGLISYQIPEDASDGRCAPTRLMSANPAETGNASPAMTVVDLGPLNAILAQGFTVSIPDYEGPASEWGAARQPGYAALDGIRAAEQFAPLALHGPATPAALWGYSGGSLASGWAAQVQPSYAPELDIRGVAAGGFLTDPASAIVQTIGTVFSGVPISVLPGLVRTSPALVAAFDEHTTPAGKSLLRTAGSQCMVENTAEHTFDDLSGALDMPFRDFMALPEVRAAFAQLNLGGSAPRVPLFVYHSVHDEMVPVADVDRTVAGYCSAGTPVTYVRDEASEHGLLGMTGAPAALNWLTERLTANPPRPQCTTRTVPSALMLTTNALGTPAKAALADARTRAGSHPGPVG